MHRFLVDAQLPPALARKIAALGHEAEHLLELGLLESSDSEIWDYALANGAVIITKARILPFVRLSARLRRRLFGSGSEIVPTSDCWRGLKKKCPL